MLHPTTRQTLNTQISNAVYWKRRIQHLIDGDFDLTAMEWDKKYNTAWDSLRDCENAVDAKLEQILCRNREFGQAAPWAVSTAKYYRNKLKKAIANA